MESTKVGGSAKVAIVGRPNVGKSSLFNRLVGRREAIVADKPGVTRDVKAARVEPTEGPAFTLLDTGGLWSGDEWQEKIRDTIAAALTDVKLILFCVDGRTGLTAADLDIANWLRGLEKDILLVVTKLDDPKHEEDPELYELYGLGLGEPHFTSAEHARGTYELIDTILTMLPEGDEEPDEDVIRVSIIGRPNVGKSSLLNALVGDRRVIVADLPGTTRDSVDVSFHFAGRAFTLVDTAGIRRKPSGDIEHYAKIRSERAVLESDVAILVVDPFELGDHELRLANFALESGKPVVIAINKWDLVSDTKLKEFRETLTVQLAHLQFAPRVYTSALTEYGLHEVLAEVVRVFDLARVRVPTSEVNNWVDLWTQRQSPPNFRGKPLKLLYTTQADIAPPTFVFSVNNETFVTRAYEQYLRNRIREDLGFKEVPIRLIFKARGARTGKRVRL
ncbi:MAG: ribosome biogenesis GTPase Der [Trueperaceae bacterium]|nr:MAG: ribosome biogenesis GTPase Der [Trueperaceae bacterium]